MADLADGLEFSRGQGFFQFGGLAPEFLFVEFEELLQEVNLAADAVQGSWRRKAAGASLFRAGMSSSCGFGPPGRRGGHDAVAARRLASYKAWSPARISRSGRAKQSGRRAQPIESVNPSGTPRRRAGLRMHSRRSRSAMRSRPARRSRQNDQKLVPAIAADAVVGPHPFGQAGGQRGQNRVSGLWPHVSLMALKRSTSIMMTLVPCRRGVHGPARPPGIG